MSDLVRNYPVIFLPLQNNIEQSFGKDDNEFKRVYTILTSLRGLYYGGTPPTSPNVGDLWHDSATNIIKKWDGSTWSAFIESTTQLTTAINEALGTPIASASTINLTTATGNFMHITGTTTITVVTLGAGMRREVIFDGILTLTHHATNNNLPGAADITTAAGDRASYYSDGTTVYCTKYVRADGTVITGIASSAEAIAGTDNTKMITPLRIRDAFNCTGTAPVYACRAWVNFNGLPATGTYSQSGTTVTVTITGHDLKVGDIVSLSPTSGTGVSGSYTVATIVSVNIFTYIAGTSLTTSGNITRNVYIRASGNVSSITDLGVGTYDINFITPMMDTNYNVTGISNSTTALSLSGATPYTTGSIRIGTIDFSNTLVDRQYNNVSIIR